MAIEINKSNGSIVQMLTLKEMRNIPLSICHCGVLYRALPDTFFGGLISMCTRCRIEYHKLKLEE